MIEIKPLASSSRGNCYHITDGVSPLLLDCGISFQETQKRLNFKTSEVCGCLVSHEHNDHSKAIPDLVKAGINCYMSAGTADEIKVFGPGMVIIEALTQFRIGTWNILPFDTKHDAEEPLGFLIADQDGDKLLYATDTAYLKYQFTGLTHAMIECNFSLKILNDNVMSGVVPVEMKRRLIRSHFSLDNVKDFFRANDLSKIREIWLIHLSDANSDEKLFKSEIQKVTGKPVFITQA